MTMNKHACYDCVHFDIKQPKDKTQRCAKDHLILGTDGVNTFCKGEFVPREGGMIMDEIRKKYDTHMVFKIEYLKVALTKEELDLLWLIHNKIWLWRQRNDKTVEGYLVINRDEHYAEFIQQQILLFEKYNQMFGVVTGFQAAAASIALKNVATDPYYNKPVEPKEQLKFPDWKQGCKLLQHDPTGELEICNHPENAEGHEGNCYEDNCPTFHKDEKDYCEMKDKEAEARLERKEKVMEDGEDARSNNS